MVNQIQQKATRGFREPLYAIEYNGDKVLAVVGANSSEHALLRAESIRHLVPMPRHELLTARFLESGPVTSAYFASDYFQWIDALDSDGGCPICGK